jgi:sugar phosphate isomerase/epimerase
MLIAVSSWSFHDELYKGKLHLSDVPFRAYDLGYRAVELQDTFLWPRQPGRLGRLLGRKTEPSVPGEYDRKAVLRTHLNRHRSGTKLVCWTIDSDLTVAEPAAQQKQKAYLAAAIQTAHFLNAPILRLTLGGERGDVAGLERAVELLRNVLPVAIASEVKLAIENHGGLSDDPVMLVDLVQRFHSPYLGVCVDFGNFEDPKDFSKPLRSLAPHAIHVHAKSRAFDANGEETAIDYRACLSALKAVKYDGAISIEYEGDGDAATGINKTRDLIQKYWD